MSALMLCPASYPSRNNSTLSDMGLGPWNSGLDALVAPLAGLRCHCAALLKLSSFGL